jgi:hypothetical protein
VPQNHEPLKSGIPKRKKTGFRTRLSCKIEYFLNADQPDPSVAAAIITDDGDTDNDGGAR